MIVSKHRRTKIVTAISRKRVFKPYPKPAEPDAVVLSYAKLLIDEVREMAALVERVVIPKLNFLTARRDSENIVTEIRFDDPSITVSAMFQKLKMRFLGERGDHDPTMKNYSKHVTRNIVEPMLKRANDHHRRQFTKQMNTVLAVDPLKAEPWLRKEMIFATQANVAKIKTIPSDYFSEIEDMVTHAVRAGDRPSTLAQRIMDRTDVYESRARLIARDQISKFVGSMEKARSEANGAKRYIWRTVRDIRVRSDHDFLDGKTFSWSDPPVTVRSGKRAGEKNHPKMDIQCRCYAENIWSDVIEGL
jgi:SPP1 gp7 family putative phage head morphogenesis protein